MRFITLFGQRCAATYAQSCHEQIQQSSRCRLYKELKENHDIEPYLRRNISCTLRITFTKMRLSSHKLLVESMCSLAVSTQDSPAVEPRSNPGSGKILMSENLRLYTTSPVVMC